MDEYSMNMGVSIDVDELGDFINNELAGILLSNTTNIGIAGFCLQAVLDAYEAAIAEVEEE